MALWLPLPESRGMLFFRLVEQAVSVSPVENKMLTGGKYKTTILLKNAT